MNSCVPDSSGSSRHRGKPALRITTLFSLARILGTCAIVALIAATASGCTSSRPCARTTAGFSDAELAELEHRITTGQLENTIPAGGRLLGVAYFGGSAGVEVLRTPDGTYYTTSPVSFRYVPVYDRALIRSFDKQFASLEKTAGTGHAEIMTPRTGATGTESAGDIEAAAGNLDAALDEQPPPLSVEDLRYEVSLPNRLARVDFVLPPELAGWFVSPVRMPYALTDWGVVKRNDGSLEIFYEASGTDTFLTDVLGAMMLQGFENLFKNDPLIGEVRLTIDRESLTATVTWNGEPAPDPYHTLSLQPTIR